MNPDVLDKTTREESPPNSRLALLELAAELLPQRAGGFVTPKRLATLQEQFKPHMVKLAKLYNCPDLVVVGEEYLSRFLGFKEFRGNGEVSRETTNMAEAKARVSARIGEIMAKDAYMQIYRIGADFMRDRRDQLSMKDLSRGTSR